MKVVIGEAGHESPHDVPALFAHDDHLVEHTMQRCLLTLFDEEWHHHWYATRDLEVLLRETS